MIALIFFELRGIATLRITLSYHFLAFCVAAVALATVITAELQEMYWSKAVCVVSMLAVIMYLLSHIIIFHQQTYEQDMADFRRRHLERFRAGRTVN